MHVLYPVLLSVLDASGGTCIPINRECLDPKWHLLAHTTIALGNFWMLLLLGLQWHVWSFEYRITLPRMTFSGWFLAFLFWIWYCLLTSRPRLCSWACFGVEMMYLLVLQMQQCQAATTQQSSWLGFHPRLQILNLHQALNLLILAVSLHHFLLVVV